MNNNTTKRLTIYAEKELRYNTTYPYMSKIKFDKLKSLVRSIRNELSATESSVPDNSIYRFIDSFVYSFAQNVITPEIFKEISMRMLGLVRSVKYAYEGNFGTYYGRTKIDELPFRVKDSLLALVPEKASTYYFNKATTQRQGNIWNIDTEKDSDEVALLKIKNFFNAHINWGKDAKDVSAMIIGSREIIENDKFTKCNEYLYYKILLYYLINNEIDFRSEEMEKDTTPIEEVASKVNDLNTYHLMTNVAKKKMDQPNQTPLEDERIPTPAREAIKKVMSSKNIGETFDIIDSLFREEDLNIDRESVKAIFENILSSKINEWNMDVSKLNLNTSKMTSDTKDIYIAIKNFKGKEKKILENINSFQHTTNENAKKKIIEEIKAIVNSDPAFKEYLKLNTNLFEGVNKILVQEQKEESTRQMAKDINIATPSTEFPLVALLSRGFTHSQEQVDKMAVALHNFFTTLKLSPEDENTFVLTIGKDITNRIKNLYVNKEAVKIDKASFISKLYDPKNSRVKNFFIAVENKLSEMISSGKMQIERGLPEPKKGDKK